MQDQCPDQIPFRIEHGPDDPGPDAPFSVREIQAVGKQFDGCDQEENQPEENLHVEVSRGDRQPTSPTASSQHEPTKDR